jgi:hypothetical protein
MRLATTWSADSGAFVIEGGSGLGSTGVPLTASGAAVRIKIKTTKILTVALTEPGRKIMRMTSFVEVLDYHPSLMFSNGARRSFG